MDKKERTDVFKNTTEIVSAGHYQASDGTIKEFYRNDEMINGTKFYSKKVKVDYNALKRYEYTKISVIDIDCLYAAEQLIHKGLNPAVLNMASFHTPGGGVERGSAAQEESIFRRTNIFRSLYQFHSVGENYNIKQLEERYPLEMHFGAIYTPSVMVFKSSENDGCKLLDNPFFIDVITMPAIKKPETENGKLAAWAKDILKIKIKQIFDIAIINGNDSLVLSAFGCGAYGTPPDEMAKLFYDTINSEKYKNAFKEIVFAIINLPSTNGSHNPEGNFKPFKKIFEQ